MSCADSKRTYQLSRREALQVGVGLFGLNLADHLRAQQAARGTSKDISCIFIFLAGGPSHFETFDPKPDAPVEIRGPWKPTHTNVPGTFICEKMPLMAQHMDKVAIVRSWQGKSGSHSRGLSTSPVACIPPVADNTFPISAAWFQHSTVHALLACQPTLDFLLLPATRRPPASSALAIRPSILKGIPASRQSSSLA